MYSYFRSVPVRVVLTAQVPALVASFLIAEAFYKFHSFTLECLAFLATWFLLDAVFTWVRGAWDSRNTGERAGGE